MKNLLRCAGIGLVACASAQHLERAYNRDTVGEFKLKSIQSDVLVMGPIVKTQTNYAFENPFNKLTEASVWFDLPQPAVLGGFGYWYKNEFVPGVLMDKNQAWFIYTAITSRNEDPGIMVQTTPSSYHAQIYPLAAGYDFRYQLSSIGILGSSHGELIVPRAQGKDGIAPVVNVHSSQPGEIETKAIDEVLQTLIHRPRDPVLDAQIYAQRFKDGYTYVAGLVRTDAPDAPHIVRGIHNVYWARPETGDTNGSVKYFFGRQRQPGDLHITAGKGESTPRVSLVKQVKGTESGGDAAKLWAHQKLVQDEWRRRKDVLRFSLKYQVPSTQTALLAVPQEQMIRFKRLAAEYRRKQREEARWRRKWDNQRPLNWNRSRGGDPEIRVLLPGAISAYALLPDRRRFELRKDADGYWGGNFDIPADAPEGQYMVRAIGLKSDGQKVERDIRYTVDRTPPAGKLSLEAGFWVVRSEPALARATMVWGDGTEEDLVEVDPGLYKLPVGFRRPVKVVLFDQAHNHRDVGWSPR
ncbi:MAG: hypothetical protein HYR64_06810 [Fimbriimonas ginsengisoli]|uniref:VIT domain-containing protein n=1 Tax=Fimbriimonas ginsengisoli TaxID=1005039 RepID=A0A931LSS3_FIMGI|nr:hypothetical protein [Fimbriimonas ginsengisoli]